MLLKKAKICIYFFISLILIFFFIVLKKYKNVEFKAKNEVNIVFIADSKYKDYLKPAIMSAILNKNKDSVYNIYILAVNIDSNTIKEYEKLATQNANIIIKELDIDRLKGIGNYAVVNSRITRTDLFKLILPLILKDLDKILCIDVDTLILGDLSELYNTDITNKYLAAVFYYYKYDTQYNNGVMLMNLKKMRDDFIVNKLLEAKKYDRYRRIMTQDAYNYAIPINKIKDISPVYNLKPTYRNKKVDLKILINYKFLYGVWNIHTGENYDNRAIIIHYFGDDKPWNNDNLPYAKEWNDYYKLSNTKKL